MGLSNREETLQCIRQRPVMIRTSLYATSMTFWKVQVYADKEQISQGFWGRRAGNRLNAKDSTEDFGNSDRIAVHLVCDGGYEHSSKFTEIFPEFVFIFKINLSF